MMASERKIIGATFADVEQAILEQYGRASLNETGRSPNAVTYIARLSPKSAAQCTISQIPEGVALKLEPYLGGGVGIMYAVLIIIGLFIFILPGLIITGALLFRIWVTAKSIGRDIDNIVHAAEHAVKLRERSSSQVLPQSPLDAGA